MIKIYQFFNIVDLYSVDSESSPLINEHIIVNQLIYLLWFFSHIETEAGNWILQPCWEIRITTTKQLQ